MLKSEKYSYNIIIREGWKYSITAKNYQSVGNTSISRQKQIGKLIWFKIYCGRASYRSYAHTRADEKKS